MPKTTTDITKYRPAVGLAVFNRQGHIWLGKRYGGKGPFIWQMPQGGIDDGETPEMAAARELFEETGIKLDMVTPIGEIDDWLFYDFPPEYRKHKATIAWRGQRQKWFAFRFHGQEDLIDLKSHGPQEFSTWKWAELSKTPHLIVPFKRKVYERIAFEFERYARPVKQRMPRHG